MDRRFALLLLCFLLSGFSALLYQTAWTREFSFVFGTSELAVAAVLAGYMGGLALGSLLAARIAPRLARPVLVYGVLELGIALSALAVPLGMRGLTAVQVALFGGADLAQPGALATVFRLGGAFALMLTPTGLMGATLPLLARHAVRRDEQIGPRIGALYAINTAGAIAGTLCAAFLLLPALGLRRTVFLGACVNAVVFVAAAALSRRAPAPAAPPGTPFRGVHWILPLILLSGAVSFAYEVLWTRLLTHLLGGSVYAFATMLSSFLLGIALGSGLGGRLARRVERAAPAFAAAQLGIGGLALLAFRLSDHLPDLARALGAGGMAGPVANAPIGAAVLLPVALCIGATFPLAVRILAPDPETTAAATARVYAWNTVGAIAGALGAGFLLLPRLGFEGTVLAGVATSLSLAAATSLLARPRPRWIGLATAVSAVALLLIPLDAPWRLLRSTPLTGAIMRGDVRYHAVGRSATVLLLEEPGLFRLLTNGLPEAAFRKPAGIPGRGLEARWLGFLPALLRPRPERMLVIGLGGGVAVEAVPPDVGAVDVLELEEEVVRANRAVGPERAVDPLTDPRTRVVIDDARGALLLTERRFDAIVSQPSHPWTAGASHLYTREFFELARSRLRDEGVFLQWISLPFVDAALMRSLVATLTSVFPHVQVYNTVSIAVLFAASDAPIDLVQGRSAIGSFADHYARYGILGIEDVAASLLLDTAGARALGAGAPINTDDRNLLASRSAQPGRTRLEFASLLEMTAPHDPLPGLAERLDGVALVHALALRSQLERATALAGSLPDPEREVALGWLAASQTRPRTATRHFRRALALAPESWQARAGLVLFGVPAVAPGSGDAARLPAELEALRRARALDAAGDVEGLRALDAALAALGRHALLHDAVTRMRIGWRLRSGERGPADEALALLDRLVPRSDTVEVSLERARAASLAGRHRSAWVALHDVAKRIQRGPRAAPLRREALQLAGELPDDPIARRVRARLVGGPPAAR